MPFQVMRVSILGTAPGGETWSVNPVYAFGDFDNPTPTFTEMAAAAAAVNGVNPGANLLGNLTTALQIKGCRLEARTLSGGLEIVGEALRGSPLSGTGSAIAPYQTSQVYSLRSAFPGGRGRGRLYWPALSSAMNTSTLRISSAANVTNIGLMAAYLAAVGNAMQTPLGLSGATLCVWSRANNALYPVNSLQTGDVLDTQRRRRDRAVETYTTATYP